MPFRKTLTSVFAAISVIAWVSICAAETLQDRYASLYEKASAEGTVVFYTSDSQGMIRGLSEYWKKLFPKVTLSILQKQSPDIASDINAQRAAGQVRVDVFDFALRNVAIDWKENGYIDPYKPFEFAALDAEDKDPDGAYIVKSLSLLSGAYNTENVKEPPKKLADVLDAMWKDKMLIAHPSTSANTKTFFMGLMKAGVIDWTFVEKLAKQNLQFTRTNGEAGRMVAAGERVMSPMLSSHNVFAAQDKGQKVKFFVFQEGAIVSEEVAGILKGAPHPNAAKLLMEVLASAEAQEAFLKTEFMWPTHPKAKPGPLLPKLSDLRTIRVDMKELSDRSASDAFVKRFDQTFGRN